MSVVEMERTWKPKRNCFKDDPAAGSRWGRVSGFVQNITAGPVMSGEADVELVNVDPSTAEKADQLVFDDSPNHIRSQSSPSA
jgi:hypothetical protein